MRNSIEVGGLRFSAPATTRTRQRAQTPTPPQELPMGAAARRAASRGRSARLPSPTVPREVKIAYLKRDLKRAALQRVEYVFPRKSAIAQTSPDGPRLAAVR